MTPKSNTVELGDLMFSLFFLRSTLERYTLYNLIWACVSWQFPSLFFWSDLLVKKHFIAMLSKSFSEKTNCFQRDNNSTGVVCSANFIRCQAQLLHAFVIGNDLLVSPYTRLMLICYNLRALINGNESPFGVRESLAWYAAYNYREKSFSTWLDEWRKGICYSSHQNEWIRHFS